MIKGLTKKVIKNQQYDSYWKLTVQNDKGKILPIMNFKMKMEHPVRSDIYEYITR